MSLLGDRNMQPAIDPTERVQRLGNVAAILIDLGRKARFAAASSAVVVQTEDGDQTEGSDDNV